jgi:hypothetical protein
VRLLRTLGPAAALLFAAGLSAQTTPTTGGTAPPPTAPGAGGKSPAPVAPGAGGTGTTGGAKLIFPTDTARPGPTTTAQFPTNLFQVPDVARSLGLTDAQLQRLNAVTRQVQGQFRDQFGRLNTLTDAERAALALQLDRQFTAAWLAAAKDVLDARQLARYEQLQAQFGGFATLTDPAIQRQLNLTDAQRQLLNRDLTWRDQQMRDIMRQAQLDRARGVQMFNDFSRAQQQRLDQLLTAEQMRQWAQLTGEPFQFPPPFALSPFGAPGAAVAPGAVPPTGTPGAVPGAPGPTTGGTAPAPIAPGAGGTGTGTPPGPPKR